MSKKFYIPFEKVATVKVDGAERKVSVFVKVDGFLNADSLKFAFNHGMKQETRIIKAAAKIAVKNGWKNIVLFTMESYECNTREEFDIGCCNKAQARDFYVIYDGSKYLTTYDAY